MEKGKSNNDRDRASERGRSGTRRAIGDAERDGSEERNANRPTTWHDLTHGEPILVGGMRSEAVRGEFQQPWNDFAAVVGYPGGTFRREHISRIRRNVALDRILQFAVVEGVGQEVGEL